MFRFEREMIPVLKTHLADLYKTELFISEFNTGSGIADLVLTTELSNESLVLNNYRLMAMFLNYFNDGSTLIKKELHQSVSNKAELKQLLYLLEFCHYVTLETDIISINRVYNPHTKNLISIEAKLKDWKSGLYQAMRYQFFSHQTFLAYPKEYIHRVDLDQFKYFNIGLISVEQSGIEMELIPEIKQPTDKISYCHLSECFANLCRLKIPLMN